MSQPIPKKVETLFRGLVSAAALGKLSLVATTRKDNGEPAYIICYMDESKGELISMHPLASMITNNIHETFVPPEGSTPKNEKGETVQ